MNTHKNPSPVLKLTPGSPSVPRSSISSVRLFMRVVVLHYTIKSSKTKTGSHFLSLRCAHSTQWMLLLGPTSRPVLLSNIHISQMGLGNILTRDTYRAQRRLLGIYQKEII